MSPPQQPLWRRLAKHIFRLVVSGGLLIYLFLAVDIRQVGSILKQVNLLWFAVAFAIMLLARVIAAARWVVLLRARGTHLSLMRAIQLGFIGNFFNSFLPSTVGGDAVRAYHLAALKGKGADSVVSVILERALGLVSLVIIATLGCAFGYDLIRGTGAVTAIAILWAILGAAALLFFTSDTWLRLLKRIVKPKRGTRLKALAGKVNALHDSTVGFRSSPRAMAAGLGLSLLFHGVAILCAWPLARSLGIDIHIGYFFVFGPIRQCIMMVPISVNGIGLREASAVFFYTKAGMTEPQALAYALLGYALMLSLSVIGGVVYACSGSFERPGAEHKVPR